MNGGRYIDRRPPENPEEVPEYLAYLIDQLNWIFNYFGKALKEEEGDG